MSIEPPTGLGDQFISREYSSHTQTANESFASHLSRNSSPNSARELKERLKQSSDFSSPHLITQTYSSHLPNSIKPTLTGGLQPTAHSTDSKSYYSHSPYLNTSMDNQKGYGSLPFEFQAKDHQHHTSDRGQNKSIVSPRFEDSSQTVSPDKRGRYFLQPYMNPNTMPSSNDVAANGLSVSYNASNVKSSNIPMPWIGGNFIAESLPTENQATEQTAMKQLNYNVPNGSAHQLYYGAGSVGPSEGGLNKAGQMGKPGHGANRDISIISNNDISFNSENPHQVSFSTPKGEKSVQDYLEELRHGKLNEPTTQNHEFASIVSNQRGVEKAERLRSSEPDIDRIAVRIATSDGSIWDNNATELKKSGVLSSLNFDYMKVKDGLILSPKNPSQNIHDSRKQSLPQSEILNRIPPSQTDKDLVNSSVIERGQRETQNNIERQTNSSPEDRIVDDSEEMIMRGNNIQESSNEMSLKLAAGKESAVQQGHEDEGAGQKKIRKKKIIKKVKKAVNPTPPQQKGGEEITQDEFTMLESKIAENVQQHETHDDGNDEKEQSSQMKNTRIEEVNETIHELITEEEDSPAERTKHRNGKPKEKKVEANFVDDNMNQHPSRLEYYNTPRKIANQTPDTVNGAGNRETSGNQRLQSDPRALNQRRTEEPEDGEDVMQDARLKTHSEEENEEEADKFYQSRRQEIMDNIMKISKKKVSSLPQASQADPEEIKRKIAANKQRVEEAMRENEDQKDSSSTKINLKNLLKKATNPHTQTGPSKGTRAQQGKSFEISPAESSFQKGKANNTTMLSGDEAKELFHGSHILLEADSEKKSRGGKKGKQEKGLIEKVKEKQQQIMQQIDKIENYFVYSETRDHKAAKSMKTQLKSPAGGGSKSKEKDLEALQASPKSNAQTQTDSKLNIDEVVEAKETDEPQKNVKKLKDQKLKKGEKSTEAPAEEASQKRYRSPQRDASNSEIPSFSKYQSPKSSNQQRKTNKEGSIQAENSQEQIKSPVRKDKANEKEPIISPSKGQAKKGKDDLARASEDVKTETQSVQSKKTKTNIEAKSQQKGEKSNVENESMISDNKKRSAKKEVEKAHKTAEKTQNESYQNLVTDLVKEIQKNLSQSKMPVPQAELESIARKLLEEKGIVPNGVSSRPRENKKPESNQNRDRQRHASPEPSKNTQIQDKKVSKGQNVKPIEVNDEPQKQQEPCQDAEKLKSPKTKANVDDFYKRNIEWAQKKKAELEEQREKKLQEIKAESNGKNRTGTHFYSPKATQGGFSGTNNYFVRPGVTSIYRSNNNTKETENGGGLQNSLSYRVFGSPREHSTMRPPEVDQILQTQFFVNAKGPVEASQLARSISPKKRRNPAQTQAVSPQNPYQMRETAPQENTSELQNPASLNSFSHLRNGSFQNQIHEKSTEHPLMRSYRSLSPPLERHAQAEEGPKWDRLEVIRPHLNITRRIKDHSSMQKSFEVGRQSPEREGSVSLNDLLTSDFFKRHPGAIQIKDAKYQVADSILDGYIHSRKGSQPSEKKIDTTYNQIEEAPIQDQNHGPHEELVSN